jgi:hypothetical protein
VWEAVLRAKRVKVFLFEMNLMHRRLSLNGPSSNTQILTSVSDSAAAHRNSVSAFQVASPIKSRLKFNGSSQTPQR